MKVVTYNNKGEKGKEINLPKQFSEEVRPDLIKRAVLVIQGNKRQAYGANKKAGLDYSATLSKRRRDFKTVYGASRSRTPRKVMLRRGTQFIYTGAVAPGTVGGRKAHPPKPERIWEQKINKNERRKAIRSAIAATLDKDLILSRGHKFKDNPIIIDNLEDFKKTKEIKGILIKLGLEKEIERTSKKRNKSGKAKIRGRKTRNAKGPLIVVEKDSPAIKAIKNIQGFDVSIVDSLNTEVLAPGTEAGRLTIWSTAAIQKLEKENLYFKKNGSVQSTKTSPSN